MGLPPRYPRLTTTVIQSYDNTGDRLLYVTATDSVDDWRLYSRQLVETGDDDDVAAVRPTGHVVQFVVAEQLTDSQYDDRRLGSGQRNTTKSIRLDLSIPFNHHFTSS